MAPRRGATCEPERLRNLMPPDRLHASSEFQPRWPSVGPEQVAAGRLAAARARAAVAQSPVAEPAPEAAERPAAAAARRAAESALMVARRPAAVVVAPRPRVSRAQRPGASALLHSPLPDREPAVVSTELRSPWRPYRRLVAARPTS